MTNQSRSKLIEDLGLPLEYEKRMLGIIATTVATICGLRPEWYFARLAGRKLRIYFGRVIVATLEKSYVWAAVDESLLSDSAESLGSWIWDETGTRPVKGKPYPRYKRPASRNGFYDPAKDPSGIEWEMIEPAHHAYLRQVARKGHSPDHRTISDPKVVDEIAKWTPFGVAEVVLKHAVSEALRASTEVRRARLAAAPKKPTARMVNTLVFNRNADVIAEVLLRSEGRCESCGQSAPFLRASDGSPYLEVHHRVRLADNGDDTVENATALCPNCHRKEHYG